MEASPPTRCSADVDEKRRRAAFAETVPFVERSVRIAPTAWRLVPPQTLDMSNRKWIERTTALMVGCTACSGATEDGGGDMGMDSVPYEGIGSCIFSPIPGIELCEEYTGRAWTQDTASEACTDKHGEFSEVEGCTEEDLLGRCVIDADAPDEVQAASYAPGETCEDAEASCKTFGGGQWQGAAICSGLPVFEQPVLQCVEPLEGEPPGQSEGGKVCTWRLLTGATEEGRHFADYSECDSVISNRPYFPLPGYSGLPEEDPRMEDPEYVEELAWVRSQVESTGCVCCHSDVAPMGAANWNIDAPGNWTSTMFDKAVAGAAGWVDYSVFGAYPAAINNGFSRENLLFPSSDPERMRAFFEEELAYRNLTPSDFADEPPGGGVLHLQRIFEPGECPPSTGVSRDGTVTWEGGPARYVYVLTKGSDNPLVPPNLDLPDGTIWRIDVPSDGVPLNSGTVRFGEPPQGVIQRFPEGRRPTPLQEGSQYYLYVTSDVTFPITRCLFTYESEA